ncbi:MAG: hypothetical protein AAF664_01650 [Planctomycetota bacterium]
MKVQPAAAGKTVKCPACPATLRVPAASQKSGATATANPSAPKSPQPPATPQATTQPPPGPTAGGIGGGELSSLFDEEGFSDTIEKVCPACSAALSSDAILCTKCGYHFGEDRKLEAHLTPGLDIDAGTMALREAQADIERSKAIQEKMEKGSGMPWWMLALVLVLAGGTCTIAVLAIRESRRIEREEDSGKKSAQQQTGGFNATLAVWRLATASFAIVGAGAWLRIAADALTRNKSPLWAGLVVLILPGFYYVFQNFRHTWRLAATAITLASMAGYCAYQAQSIINSTA